MLTDTEKKHLRGTITGLARVMSGFKERRPQLKMMGEIALAFATGCQGKRGTSGEWLAVLEAPTGVGKSAAGAAAALAVARERGKRVVVSSSTVALQHQLMQKDLPTLQQALPFHFTFALAKGRGRYACPAKLARIANPRQSAMEGFDAATFRNLATRRVWPRISPTALGTATAMSSRWRAATTSGLAPARTVTAAPAACAHHDACPYYTARATLKHADLIVTNHDLLIASLEIGEDGPLPAAKDTLFVVDEAHGLCNTTVEHLASRHVLRAAVGWITDATTAVAAVANRCVLKESIADDAERSARNLSAYLLDMARLLSGTGTLTADAPLVIKGSLPADLRTMGESIQATAAVLEKALDTCAEALRCAKVPPDALQTLAERLGKPRDQLQTISKTWQLLLDDQPAAPVARWIERRDSVTGGSEFTVCATPIRAAEALDRLLWTQAAGVALVSATLSSCDSFGPFLTDAGLVAYPGLRLARLSSPFDYANRAQLIVPRMTSDPRDSERHTAEVAALLPDSLPTVATWCCLPVPHR